MRWPKREVERMGDNDERVYCGELRNEESSKENDIFKSA